MHPHPPNKHPSLPRSSPPANVYDAFVTANSQLEVALGGVHAALNHGHALIALTKGTYKTWDDWSEVLKQYCQVSGDNIRVEGKVNRATRMKQLQRMDKNNKARLDGLPKDIDIYSRMYVCSRGQKPRKRDVKPRDSACGFYISVKMEKCGGEWIIRIVNANFAHDHRKKTPSEVAAKQRKPKSNDHADHLKALVQKVTTIETFLANVEHTQPEARSTQRVERSVHAMLGPHVDLNFLDEPPFAPSISIAPGTMPPLQRTHP